jgi:hypothetical protein
MLTALLLGLSCLLLLLQLLSFKLCSNTNCACAVTCKSSSAAAGTASARTPLLAAHRNHCLCICHCSKHFSICCCIIATPLRFLNIIRAHASHCPVQDSRPDGDRLAHGILQRQQEADRYNKQ